MTKSTTITLNNKSLISPMVNRTISGVRKLLTSLGGVGLFKPHKFSAWTVNLPGS